MAKLSEILSEIEDNVKVQFLAESMVKSMDNKRTRDTEVTFSTKENNTSGLYSGEGKTALIVWVDRDEFNQAMQKCNEENQNHAS